MTPREIIARAWQITTEERGLRSWGLFSSLFETLRTLEMLLFQAYYLYWFSKGVTVGWVSLEVFLFEHLPLWGFIAITTGIVLLFIFELFVPTLATGAIIGLGAKAYKGEEVKGGMVLALYNFFQILEIHGLFILSNVGVAVTAISIVVRYAGDDFVRTWALGLLIFLICISTIFHVFSSFAEEGIVIRKEGVFKAIGRSFKLIISNLSHVLFLSILMIVISVRIIFNAVVVLVFPSLLTGIFVFLTLFVSPTISYAVTAVIGVILLFILSYFFSYLQIFRQTVWTITYLELSNRKDLDVIEENS